DAPRCSSPQEKNAQVRAMPRGWAAEVCPGARRVLRACVGRGSPRRDPRQKGGASSSWKRCPFPRGGGPWPIATHRTLNTPDFSASPPRRPRRPAGTSGPPGDAWAAGRRTSNQASKSLREIPRARGRTSDDAHSVRSATDELVPWVRAAHCVEQPIG
ncbi:unnamed protein product, partial [Prorocentrum cordatum]